MSFTTVLSIYFCYLHLCDLSVGCAFTHIRFHHFRVLAIQDEANVLMKFQSKSESCEFDAAFDAIMGGG